MAAVFHVKFDFGPKSEFNQPNLDDPRSCAHSEENSVGRFEWSWCHLACFKDTGIIGLGSLALQLTIVLNILYDLGVELPSGHTPFGVVWGMDGGMVASNSYISTREFVFCWVCRTQYNHRYFTRKPARELVVEIEPEKVSKKLYFHAFTGCNIVSAFRRNGEKEHEKPATFVMRFL